MISCKVALIGNSLMKLNVANNRKPSTVLMKSRSLQADCNAGWHTLPDKMRLEVLTQMPEEQSNKPPLLFLHGTAHGAWCWKVMPQEENFFPYFSERGYPSYALSLRGQGNSDQGDLKTAGTLVSHAADIKHFIATLPAKPIIIGHSFAGLFVQYLCLDGKQRNFLGVVTLCSVPPSGNGPMIQRFMKRDFLKAAKISWGVLTKSYKNDKDMCKFLFFSDSIPEEDLTNYHAQIAKCSPLPIVDINWLNKRLPLEPLTVPVASLVIGAENDNFVDKEAIYETAEWLNSEYVILQEMAHDVMLDKNWEKTAACLYEWIESICSIH